MSIVERITDKNYDKFIQKPKAVLLLTLSNCSFCDQLKPFIARLASSRSDIAFGEAILDQGHLIKLKKTINMPKCYSSLIFYHGQTIFTVESTQGTPIIKLKIYYALKMMFGEA